MLTFIIAIILTSFICLCFFKKKFWENRYLVLLIGGGVALVATLFINLSMRGHLQTKTEIIFKKPLHTFYVPDSLFKDSIKTPRFKNYNYYDKYGAYDFYRDTTKNQTPVTIIFYSFDKKNRNILIGTFKKKNRQDYYDFNKVYIVQSSADSVAYVSKKGLRYDVEPNNWITGFSLPRKSTITVLHIPPKEFALIPDSLIRKPIF